jgi:hypothetical protein
LCSWVSQITLLFGRFPGLRPFDPVVRATCRCTVDEDGALADWCWKEINQSNRRKTVKVPFCSPGFEFGPPWWEACD